MMFKDIPLHVNEPVVIDSTITPLIKINDEPQSQLSIFIDHLKTFALWITFVGGISIMIGGLIKLQKYIWNY